MIPLSGIIQSARVNVYTGMLLATLFGFFAYSHFSKFQETQQWPLLLVILSEILTVGFFICRRDPKTVSAAPSDWIFAIVGSFAPLFFRPALWGVLPSASSLIVLGTIIQIVSLLSLNRSFALVAAKREIKTAWMYRIMRHPLYGSYLLVFGGYVLVNTTSWNLIVYAIMLMLLCVRTFREEKHLALDPAYRAYMLKVRYRIIPFVF
jgi:protein-S-isoprenylcysteine O-methyltransferase Ste14